MDGFRDMRIATINLTTTDPAYNLAAEQYVFDCLPRDRSYVMLWQNDNAIIVGKYQNTAAEINADYVAEHGIRVVRRLSGGGAVYHDMGNLNFTLISDAGELGRLNMKLFCEPVVRTLARYGVKAEIGGRNDITVDGRKFSGNSQYIKNGRVMHHGTILFDSDLSVVQAALAVKAEKIRSKGVSSVRARVTNLRPYLPEGLSLSEFRESLLEEMTAGGEAEPCGLRPEDREAIARLREERYATWEWNYGASPVCTMKKSRRIEGCGSVEALMTLTGGRISSLLFQGDFFSSSDPALLAKRLIGVIPERAELEKALAGVDVSAYITGLSGKDLTEILSE